MICGTRLAVARQPAAPPAAGEPVRLTVQLLDEMREARPRPADVRLRVLADLGGRIVGRLGKPGALARLRAGQTQVAVAGRLALDVDFDGDLADVRLRVVAADDAGEELLWPLGALSAPLGGSGGSGGDLETLRFLALPGLPLRVRERAFEAIGTQVWDAGVALARGLLRGALPLRGRRVLELGAGCGVPSLAAAHLGAASVVATDRADALELLAGNVSPSPTVSVALLDWGGPAPPCDVVLAADVLYARGAMPALIETLRQAVAAGAADVLLAVRDRAPGAEQGLRERLEFFGMSPWPVEEAWREEQEEGGVVVYRVVVGAGPGEAAGAGAGAGGGEASGAGPGEAAGAVGPPAV